MTRTLSCIAFVVLVLVAYPQQSRAQQAIETETARPLKHGEIELGAAYEFQTSAQGLEHAIPFAFELGLFDRFELLVEPVAITAIRPSDLTPKATGVGDLELTLFGLVAHESPLLPAISLAVEVKVPTARNNQIGTGKTDVAGYLVMSKRVGAVDFHVNLGYTVIGQPMGLVANNIFSFAVAGMWAVTKKFDLFAESYGNTAASPEGPEGGGPSGGPVLVAELAQGEVVGSAGGQWNINPTISVSLGASYDTNNAFQLRTGIVLKTKAF